MSLSGRGLGYTRLGQSFVIIDLGQWSFFYTKEETTDRQDKTRHGADRRMTVLWIQLSKFYSLGLHKSSPSGGLRVGMSPFTTWRLERQIYILNYMYLVC